MTREGRTVGDAVSVRVRKVPTLLVVRSDEYVHELLRELELIRLGRRRPSRDGRSPVPGGQPTRSLATVESTLQGFSAAHLPVRAQVEEALAAGRERVDVVVAVSDSAAEAIADLPEALGLVRGYADEGLLLTLPPEPGLLRFLERWTTEVMRQLRGDEPGADPFVVDEGDGELLRLRPEEATGDRGSQRAARRVRITLPPDPSAPRQARRLLRTTLADWHLDGLADLAELPASELVTNALLHAGTAIDFELSLRAGTLRVEVRDHAASLPVNRLHDREASVGRGLALVEALAARWGTRPSAEGKSVWFELDTADG